MGNAVARNRRISTLSIARFLVNADELDREEVLLRGAELRHLRARRLGPGAEIVLSDGGGRERRAIVLGVSRTRAVIRIQPDRGGVPRPVESPLRLTLAQAALKADKLDLVVEKATELGIANLVVFTSSRCVAKPASERLRRWERLARSAAKQCQRTCIPSVRGPVSFTDVLAEARHGLALLFWEDAGSDSRLVSNGQETPEAVLAMVGPEGGFSADEVAAARAAGFRIVGLGPRILRAETAAIVAVTMCQSLWGDLAMKP